MTIEAERNYNEKHRTKKDRLKLDIYVVEKNPNAIVTLRFMNEKWLVFYHKIVVLIHWVS